MDDQPKTLLISVVQAQDADTAERTLCAWGLKVNRLPSVGGFLGRRNCTLLVAATHEQTSHAIQALRETCRQRVEYIVMPLDSAPLPLPTPTAVTVGGASIFSMEIEYFEEF
jgi:uncharacterized protein YaaQ